MSSRTEPGAPAGDAYRVCLDCGKRLAYDLKELHGWSRQAVPQAGKRAPK